MKKIFKKLLITTALVTPIAISTPLLLTSCSADVEIAPDSTNTNPSIFEGLDKILKVSTINEGEGSTTTKSFYNLSTSTPDKEVQNISNETINKIKALTSGATFSNQVDGIIATLFSDVEFIDNNTTPPTEGNSMAEFSKKTKLPLSKKEHFITLNKLISGLKLNNIFVNEASDNATDKTPQINSSILSDNVINLEKMADATSKIDTTIEVTVGEVTVGTGATAKKFVETEIAIILTPKKDGETTYKWAGLNTSHPIEISVEFVQEEKATLLDGGFPSDKQPSLSSDAIEIKGTLNKDVFGADADSKITGTNKIKEWFESDNGTVSNGSGGNSSTTTAAINKSVKKITQIFEKTTDLKSGTGDTASNYTGLKLTSKYIEGANQANQKQSPTPRHAIGQETVQLNKVDIKKSTSTSGSNKSFDITLNFVLIADGAKEWFGITEQANKAKAINLVLTVVLGSTPSKK